MGKLSLLGVLDSWTCQENQRFCVCQYNNYQWLSVPREDGHDFDSVKLICFVFELKLTEFTVYCLREQYVQYVALWDWRQVREDVTTREELRHSHLWPSASHESVHDFLAFGHSLATSTSTNQVAHRPSREIWNRGGLDLRSERMKEEVAYSERWTCSTRQRTQSWRQWIPACKKW